MRGYVENSYNTFWKLNPKVLFYIALRLTYLILDVASDGSYVMVGVPDRKFLWIMTRARPMSLSKFNQASSTEGERIIDDVGGGDSNGMLTHGAEKAVMTYCLRRASELGYEIKNVQRNLWED